MKRTMTGLLTTFIPLVAIHAQIVIPATPGKFATRALGDGVSGGVDVIPRDGAASDKVRYTTHIVLSTSRLWTSTEGKLLEGKLIAFEDLVAEGVQGAAPPAAPAAPPHPTVTRDGKIRLLVSQKPVLIPLSRLSPADQEFVRQVETSYQAKTPPAR